MTDSINTKKPSGIPPGCGSINKEHAIMTISTSRRAILAGAAVLPALAVPAAFALPTIAPNADAELIALGERFEPLLAAHMSARFEWAPLSRAASAELEADPKYVSWADATDKQSRAQQRRNNAIHKRNGCDAASNRMSAIFARMEPIAEKIVEIPASTLEGLRAKALVVLFEAMPACADHEGELEMADDGGASKSLFMAAAELTGLGPMVREIEARLAADATVSDDMAEQS